MQFKNSLNFIVNEFFICILFLLLSGLNILSLSNFLYLYLFIEIFSFLLYILIICINKRIIVIEAGFIFFLIGSFVSILFLFGCLLFYGFYGSF